MKPIQCDNCKFLGGRYKSGVIHIQSGVTPMEEPYLTCLKHQYFVLEREAHKCQEFQAIPTSPAAGHLKKTTKPFSDEEILAQFPPGAWLCIIDLIKGLDIHEKKKSKYLLLTLKSLMKRKILTTKITQGIQYWQRCE
jgi:hypothetical protein